MSTALICDIIFNYEGEWGLQDIVGVARNDYEVGITIDQVQKAVDFLIERGCLDAA